MTPRIAQVLHQHVSGLSGMIGRGFKTTARHVTNTIPPALVVPVQQLSGAGVVAPLIAQAVAQPLDLNRPEMIGLGVSSLLLGITANGLRV